MTFMRETTPSTFYISYSSLPNSFSWTMSHCLHFFGLQSNPQFHNCISLAHSPPLCMLLFLVAIAHNLSIVDQIFDLIPCTPLLLVFPFHDPLCLGHSPCLTSPSTCVGMSHLGREFLGLCLIKHTHTHTHTHYIYIYI